MNKRILDKDVQQFIRANRQLSPAQIALRKSPFSDVSAGEIAKQIDGWQRSVNKLPTWAYSENIYYPNKINLEQCSSEHTALIKQTLIPKGAKVIDMTGGFGVDTCYIAQEAQHVIHCELDTELSDIVRHNTEQLRVHNVACVATDGVNYLREQPDDSFDYIYIDPSRRVNHSKVFRLEDCEPNIVACQGLFFAKSSHIITKLSPLLDITNGLRSLHNVKMIYVISLDNDCKELLFMQERGFEGEPIIRAIRLFKDQLQDFTFTYEQEKAILTRYKTPQTYLYEPDVSIIKAGAFKSIGKYFGLGKLHQHTHLYTADVHIPEFPGRVFGVARTIPFSELKKNNPYSKANITTRNFPLKVEDIRKRYKIKDGGDIYLFFTTDINDKLLVIECVR